MTAQIAEVLLFEGNWHHMLATPLEEYFAMGGLKPGFKITSTALWRGYVGRWEIVDKRLYMTQLSGLLDSGVEASMASVFPGFGERVFAHWYSGTIRLPMGKLLEYVHSGFSSRFERDVFLELKEGILIAKRERHNGQADEDAKEGYRVAAMTVFNVDKKKGDS